MGAAESLQAEAGHPRGDRPSPRRPPVLDDLARSVAPVALAGDRTLPLRPDLVAVVPGLRRGTVVELEGPAATSLALALAAGPSAAGSWVAAVGLPGLGLVAAAEAGVDLERTAVVGQPGERWATIVATLVDAIDVVITTRPPRLRSADVRRLTARVRERGSVLVVVGAGWPDRTDLHLTVESARWSGLGEGHGHLQERRLEVTVDGRGSAGRRRRGQMMLTGPWQAARDEAP